MSEEFDSSNFGLLEFLEMQCGNISPHQLRNDSQVFNRVEKVWKLLEGTDLPDDTDLVDALEQLLGRLIETGDIQEFIGVRLRAQEEMVGVVEILTTNS